MYCDRCGKRNPDNARFCIYCRNPLYMPYMTTPKPKKKKKLFLIIGISVTSILLLIAAVFLIRYLMSDRQKPEPYTDTAKENKDQKKPKKQEPEKKENEDQKKPKKQEPEKKEEDSFDLTQDEIVCKGDHYYLCKKNVSDFSESTDYYGIYDTLTHTWTVDYMELGGKPDSKDISYCGDGIFCYQYDHNYSGKMYFISSDYGGEFKIESDVAKFYASFPRVEETGYHGFYFYGGKTVIYYQPGPSSYEMCLVTSKGSIKSIEKWGFYDQKDYSYYCCDETCTTFVDFTEKTIHIFDYESEKMIDILDEVYYDSLDTEEHLAKVHINGSKIIFTDLVGKDGYYYYAEFDKKGNEITPPTRQD